MRSFFSFFFISSKSRFHNPIIILPYIHTFSFLFFISFVSSHMDYSVLLGLLYLDVYRHGRDPLTHHASTSNINLRSKGSPMRRQIPRTISSWTPSCVKSSIHPVTDLLQSWEEYLPLSSCHLHPNSCPHQLLMDQILNAIQGELTVWFLFSIVIDAMLLALYWCWHLCKAPRLHQRSTPSCIQMKGWLKQALLMKS